MLRSIETSSIFLNRSISRILEEDASIPKLKKFPFPKKLKKLVFSKKFKAQKNDNFIDIKNQTTMDMIKHSKIYMKLVIKKYSSVLNIMKIRHEDFYELNEDTKKICVYFAVLIQTNFRGYMIRKSLIKMNESIKKIIYNIRRYTGFKKMIFKTIHMFNVYSFKKLKGLLKIMYKKYKTYRIVLTSENKKTLKKFCVRFLSNKEIQIPNMIKSINLINFLENVCHSHYK
jgi:hypothetical protein